jgi:hypothetical protein
VLADELDWLGGFRPLGAAAVEQVRRTRDGRRLPMMSAPSPAVPPWSAARFDRRTRAAPRRRTRAASSSRRWLKRGVATGRAEGGGRSGERQRDARGSSGESGLEGGKGRGGRWVDGR